MTPPNELEQLAEFQDAIQSDEGLERLRAMQYLQQMNNQGIMGLPQVRQQPVIQRDNGGRITFKNLAEVDAAKEAGQLNVGDTFLVENIPGEFTIDSDGSIGLLELDAGTKAMMEEGTMQDSDIILDQFDSKGNLKSDSFLRKNQDGGPVVNKFIGGGFKSLVEQVKDSDVFKPTENTGTPQVISTSVPFMGGSGIATPDPNVSQAEALDNLRNMTGPFGGAVGSGIANVFEQGLMSLPSRGAEGLKETVNYQEAQEDPMSSPQAMNDEIVNTQGENIPFNFGAARFLSRTGGPVPLRENTGEGIFNRSIKGGVVETPNFVANLQPNPRYEYGMTSIKDTWGSNSPPQTVNLPIQSQDVVNTFMPTNMVEYTPPFIGGGMVPQPRMVPADEQGNPIMPISKQALGFGAPMTAAQGGYVLDLAGGGSIADAAQGLAGFGRYGDNMLVHMNPNEVAGLMSLGNLTINPVTGLPEAFSLKSFFRPIRKVVSAVTKPIRKVVKSKAFKALAPLVLAVAAPYALGALAPSVFGAGATALGGALSTSGALGYGLATGLGSMAGNLLGGARFGDAARQGLISGATGGLFKGIGSGNWMGTGNAATAANVGKVTQVGPGAQNIQAGTQVAKAPVTGGNPFAAAQQSQQAAQQAAQASKIGSNILTTPGGIEAYKGTGLQANQMMDITPGAAQNVTSNVVPEFSNIQFTTEGVPSAPEATRTGFFGKGPLSPTGGTLGGEGYTGSTFDKIKQVGKNIYADYANPKGVAKLVGMDLMQPNWDEIYASEEAMENQLADMGYTIDTGFDGQKVIRDSSGTVMPSNLSVQDILDRALGRTPRTRLADRIGFEPNASQFAAKGGLVSLAHGGEFSGKVEGDGHGMEDNVYMPIVEKEQGKQIGTLAVSPSEYVVDAHTMSALGNGNADEGAKVMDSVIASVRKKAFGTTQQPKEIDGLSALTPMMERV